MHLRLRASIAIAALTAPLLIHCTALVDTGGLAGDALGPGSSDGEVESASATDGGAIDSDAQATTNPDANADAGRAIPEGAVQWPSNGHYYVLVVKDAITWFDAEDEATALGGHLATITSADENSFVYEIVRKVPSAWLDDLGPWLGGFQSEGSLEPGDGWSWVTGEPFVYERWAEGQPDDASDEEHLHFMGDLNGNNRWNDLQGSIPLRGYVVELE